LSEPEVIQRLNNDFVCTMLLVDEAKQLAAGGNELAKLCETQWRYPVEIIFISPDGKLVSELNSAQDFPDLHSVVASPHDEQPGMASGEPSHKDVFLRHLAIYFDKK